ncbi:type II toxin-antitoxin system PemK/MazF family toxin [Ralstonia pseudosolanacearum]|uniref:Growth inhibitor PemK n=1 Tax=Ralstonia solanacearum TaxID=305 RepID=A0A0S4TNE3_RALSL|nr:type II toxin-antitoxin system PemK/MazF family toxin [Ralstonia pseudosolanacearum]QCX50070.1 growth inhibitor PemK [Ralstonia pseudosolanacearum]CUV11594.1 putative PemK-like protein 1 (Protein mazF)(ChpA) [Ralstonia solanacearum]
MKKQGKSVVIQAISSVAQSPAEGEIWWISLDPTKGHEQNGWRPIVVVSPGNFNDAAGRLIAVPCTTKAAPPGTHRAQLQVQLAETPEPTYAMPDQVRVLDWKEHKAQFRGQRATSAELDAIRERLKVLQGIQ